MPLMLQRTAASIPPEVMQLMAAADVGPADHVPIAIRRGVHIEDDHRVALRAISVKCHHVCELFGRRRSRFRSSAIEAWINWCAHALSSLSGRGVQVGAGSDTW